MTRQSITHQSHSTIEDRRRFQKEQYYTTYIIYVDFKVDICVKIVDVGLCFYFYFLFFTLFFISFLFYLLFLEQLGLGSISHAVTSVTRLITRLGEQSRRFWNKVTLYSMDNTCWPYVILMVIQGRVHSSQHGPWVLVYKVDYFVLGILLSSLMSLQYKSCFLT